MSTSVYTGVDWAGGGWLAVNIKDGSYDTIAFEPTFEELWTDSKFPSVVLVDVPIGLPEDEQSLACREELDSCARSVSARPSSVFPVPSRGACQIAYEDNASYEEVVERNEDDLEKGLNWQSYYIAKGIGEVDAFLGKDNSAREM